MTNYLLALALILVTLITRHLLDHSKQLPLLNIISFHLIRFHPSMLMKLFPFVDVILFRTCCFNHSTYYCPVCTIPWHTVQVSLGIHGYGRIGILWAWFISFATGVAGNGVVGVVTCAGILRASYHGVGDRERRSESLVVQRC